MSEVPKAFISYSWDNKEHKKWVKGLATRLRNDGVNITLDQWETTLGDQLPEFMEKAIRDNDFILIICTPRYKKRSDNREGGVGYEGDIMTGEVLSARNEKQFIPILHEGSERQSIPSWLKGRYYLDLCGVDYNEQHYQDLLLTLHGKREKAPPIGVKPSFDRQEELFTKKSNNTKKNSNIIKDNLVFEPIKIKGVIIDEVTSPKRDGTRGSALYRIPFKLSHQPTREWIDSFIRCWNFPPHFTTMHRPAIANVIGDKIILGGTTMEEVEQYHRETLVMAVAKANEETAKLREEERKRIEEEYRREQEHRKSVKDISDKLKFD